MKRALLIVDVQNDFVEGGSLAVEGGRDLSERLAKFIESDEAKKYSVIATTQDWHIDPGEHFSDDPDFVNSWPKHCIARTDGAKIVPVLMESLMGRVNIAVHKGMYEAAYSGFEGFSEDGTLLATALAELNVTHVDVVGIATDYCVAETALDSAVSQFKTAVLKEYTVGINENKVQEILNKTLPNSGVKVK